MVTRHGWVRNPLSVIAIFAGVAEVCGAAVLPQLSGDAQIAFMRFVMFFPCALIGLFFFVLWFKAKVLYAPGDYQNDESFKQMHGVYSTDGENATNQTDAQYSEPATDDIAPEHLDANKSSESATATPATEPSNNSPEIREPLTPYGQTKPPTRETEEQKSASTVAQSDSLISKFNSAGVRAYLAEKYALSELQRRYGGIMTAPAIMSSAGAPPFMIDGFISNGSLQYIVEVIHANHSISRNRILAAAKKLVNALETFPAKDQENTICVICIVTNNYDVPEGLTTQIQDMMDAKLRRTNFRIETMRMGQLD